MTESDYKGYEKLKEKASIYLKEELGIELESVCITASSLEESISKDPDTGYESEENYQYLEKNGTGIFIRPSNHEYSKTKRFQKEMEYRLSMEYDPKNDRYICKNGKELTYRCSRCRNGKNRISASLSWIQHQQTAQSNTERSLWGTSFDPKKHGENCLDRN